MLNGTSAEAVGARSIGLSDALIDADMHYFNAWRNHAGIHLTVVPKGQLRPGIFH